MDFSQKGKSPLIADQVTHCRGSSRRNVERVQFTTNTALVNMFDVAGSVVLDELQQVIRADVMGFAAWLLVFRAVREPEWARIYSPKNADL